MQASKNNLGFPIDCEYHSGYLSGVVQILKSRFPNSPTAFVQTYGCQQNVSDSERIKGVLIAMGYTICDCAEDADFVIYNTCAVRAHAEDRVFGNVGELKALKRKNPKMIIAICGCMSEQPQVAQKFKSSYPHIDILFGTNAIHRLPEFVYLHISSGERIFVIGTTTDIVEGLPAKRDGEFKGWLPIMYGCNNFCTYCIVPYVRGRERSRLPQNILDDAVELINSGVKEITLLGQNVNSYGKDEQHGVSFAELLRMLNYLDGEFRIRFMTSHPKDCTTELLYAIRDCDKVCKNLHLPVQCGNDRVLKEMNRHYTAEDYRKTISSAREIIPEIMFSSDVIVGFPGETEREFEDTLKLVDEVGFLVLFTFIYSKREGTPAALMPDLIKKNEKSRWFSQLLKLQEKRSKEVAATLVGKQRRVLCEESGKNSGTVLGRTSENAVIEFTCGNEAIGTFKDVYIGEHNGYLKGKLI